jgi:hypothetical protein
MRTIARISGAVTIVVAALCFGAAGAVAQPGAPPNDNRAAAIQLGALPQTLRGTTIGSTTERTEPASDCAEIGGSVWYSLPVGSVPPSRIGIKLDANGDLDAVLDVYVRQRSQNQQVDCRRTDRDGKAALAFAPSPNTTYLFRVAELSDSASGTFSVRVFALPAPPRPPGTHLGARGAHGVLDGTLNTRAAYAMDLTAGTTYKINLVKSADGCMELRLFAPGTSSFDSKSAGGLSCAGYRLFTPSVSGVWSFLIVAASSNDGTQPFALHVARATSKETAPGIFLANFARYKGFLRGNVIDDVRLFRFDVTQRSDLELDLQADGPFDLKLYGDWGHLLQCECGFSGPKTIRRQARPGRYFVVVQAISYSSGSFTLTRQSRLITHVNVTFDGARNEQVLPGAVTRLAAHVTPAVDGPVTISIEYFDPVYHWQYSRTFHLRAVHGLATVPFVPAHLGRWRAFVSYDGTKTASPATGGPAQILVAGPLKQ